jgi:hypothetical protein
MKKALKVSDNYRTNPVSLIPGGSTVEVHLIDGKIFIYDKVKNPSAYIKCLRKTCEISKVYIDGKSSIF